MTYGLFYFLKKTLKNRTKKTNHYLVCEPGRPGALPKCLKASLLLGALIKNVLLPLINQIKKDFLLKNKEFKAI